MNTENFLTKDEELNLGKKIQAHYKALRKLDKDKEKLSVDEKDKLTAIVAEGKQAVEELITANMGLVYERARAYKRKTNTLIEMDDLIQHGHLGLMIAVKKYDPKRDCKFSTVAYYWISQSISREANKTGRIVYLPENRINDFIKINKFVQSLGDDVDPSTVDDKILAEFKLSKKDLSNIRSAAYNHTSLNKTVGSDSDSTKELMDFVSESQSDTSSEDAVIKQELNNVLLKAVENLTPLQKDVVLSSFNITSQELMSPDEIKNKYGLQNFKFKKIQNEAMRDLKKYLETEGLNFADFVNIV